MQITTKQDLKDSDQSLVFKAITKSSSIWRQGTNGKITISFGKHPNIPIHIIEDAWSYIGNESDNELPSMNLPYLDPPFGSFEYMGKMYEVPVSEHRNHCTTIINQSRKCKSNPSKENCGCHQNWKPGAVVIHEFGHALGMMHEHQNNLENSNELKLNEQAVINFYGDRDAAFNNVIDVYQCTDDNCEYDGTKFDSDSIMLYYLPDDWVIGENPTYPNFTLSRDDIGWLQVNYPPSSRNKPKLKVSFVDSSPEPWKMAWVEKVVMENFGEVLGIEWEFMNDKVDRSVSPKDTKTYDDTGFEDTYEYACVKDGNVLLSNIETGEKITKKDVTNMEKTGTKLSPGELAGAVIGGVILVLIIIILVFYKDKLYNLVSKNK